MPVVTPSAASLVTTRYAPVVATGSVGGQYHVKIGAMYFMVRPYSYQKRAAPLFGARVTSGDPDYNNLSIWQHWAQTCWVGGIDADQWVDDAMYDEAVGVDTTVHERVNLSRDLTRATGGALDAASLNYPRRFIVYRNSNLEANVAYLYALTMPPSGSADNSKLWKYSGGSWAVVKTWTKKAKCFTIFGKKLCIGFLDGDMQTATDPAGTWTTVGPPAGVTAALTALQTFNSKLYCAYEDNIYRRKSDMTVDGSTVFYEATAADQIIDMQPHLGFLYFMSSNARIYRTDGFNTFDIWGWDNNTKGTSIVSYDGRLFVATYEYTDTADIGYGVLYQFTGSAVTQLKRFGAFGKATILGRMTVYDRKMFYGASGLWGMNKDAAGSDLGGFGVACYDAVEDAHSIWMTNKDTTIYADTLGSGKSWIVDDVIVHQGVLHAAVRSHGNFKSEVTFRDYLRDRATYDTYPSAVSGTSNAGFLVSSDYDAGTVGISKLWKSITVHCDLVSANVSIGVDYSLDGGKTWVVAGEVTKTSTATRFVKLFKLDNVRGNRFKYRVRLESTTSTQSPVLRGVVVAYLPLPEPNWLWEMVVVCSNKQELLDGTVATVDAKAQMDYLDLLYRDQRLFNFVDIDGVSWTAPSGNGAFIYDMQRTTAIQGKTSTINPLEGDIRLTILEAVESY